MDWRWLDSAQHISDDEQSLESASGDAPYILNGDDFGGWSERSLQNRSRLGRFDATK